MNIKLYYSYFSTVSSWRSVSTSLFVCVSFLLVNKTDLIRGLILSSCYSLTWLKERSKLACGGDDKQDFVSLQVYFEKQIEGKKCGIKVLET